MALVDEVLCGFEEEKSMKVLYMIWLDMCLEMGLYDCKLPIAE